VHDPDFLVELVSLGKVSLVNYICKLMLVKLKHDGSVGRSLPIPLKEIVRLFAFAEVP
jgi:hypothetical protein